MSAVLEEEIKRWAVRRKSALVLEIIQGKTTVSEASRQFDLLPSEIEIWIDDGRRGMMVATNLRRAQRSGQVSHLPTLQLTPSTNLAVVNSWGEWSVSLPMVVN